MTFDQLRIAFYSLFLICNFIFFCVFIMLLVYYCTKTNDNNTVIYCQIHLLIFSSIYAICNLSTIIYIIDGNSYSFALSCLIQSFFRLFSMIGIPTSELGILIFTFISFKFSTFTGNHPKLLKLIISLVIWIPVLIIILPELIYFLVKRQIYCHYNRGGMCLAQNYTTNFFVNIILLIVFYIAFLISLHYVIRSYFKIVQSKDSYVQYQNKLIIFYVSLIFTFPQILIYLYTWLLNFAYKKDEDTNLSIGLYVVYYISFNVFILISSLIYCVNKKILQKFKEKICCKKEIYINSEEERLIQISLINQSTIN